MSRNLKVSETNILWGRAAGRCELCNKLLGVNETFKVEVNIGERAHINAYSEKGPRYNKELKENKNSIDNIMLLCKECHIMVDRNHENYPEEFLRKKKYDHELRVEKMTECRELKTSIPMYFFSNIKNMHPEYDDRIYREAIVKNGFVPLMERAVNLGYGEMLYRDGTKKYYADQSKIIEEKVKNTLKAYAGDSEHFSIFAIAPIPVLVKLGTVLSDYSHITVFQKNRTDKGWNWKSESEEIEYLMQELETDNDKDGVALNISLSADIINERILDTGEFSKIYKITIPNPNRNFVVSERIADGFVEKLRETMELIKKENPKIKRLHVFCAMPHSLATRMGMDYMPKTDPELIMYDQINPGEIFKKTINIGG